MKLGKIGLPKRALEIRLEMNGRVLWEGTTRDLPPETAIGRAADCGWRIPPTDKTASNHHARLYSRRGKWWVEDTGSRNGMYCKGEKVARWCLAAGDQVSIGDCVLVAAKVEEKDSVRAEHHRLEQLNGADAGRMIDLDRDSCIVGSAPACDIVCDDNLVSHRHAEVACKRDGSCWVRDLKSRNGTRVNRVPLKANERMLRDGDILSVAYVDFRFWDKNTAHAPSNIRMRAAVAAMTVLVCLAGWFFWSAAHPSAENLCQRARHQAERGHFQEALHLTAAARLARHHDVYGGQIQELALSIRNWQNTAMAWEAIQGHMQDGKWVWAQQGFTQVSKWDWNTDTAIEHKRRGECVERLLNAYLDMRGALGNAYSAAPELAAARAAWEKALADAEREPAMQASVWPIAFEAETGSGETARTVAKDTAYTDVWHPLREAGNAIAGEIAVGLAAEREIRAVHEADERHKAERTEERKAEGERVPLFCHLAGNEYNRVWMALGDLAAAEKTVVSNLETMASMEPGWEGRLQPQLAFPTHTDEILFRDYQAALTNANASLCGVKLATLKNTHLAAFRNMGMEGPEGTPTAVARLTRPGMIQEAMRFIDWTQPPPARWDGETPIPGCVYDEILGWDYTYRFLSGSRTELEESPENLAEGGRYCPVARQARDDYEKLASFVAFVNGVPMFKSAATRLAPLPGRRPNRLKQYYEQALRLLRERDAWLEEEVEPYCKGEDRSGALARALWLIVSPQWKDQMHAEAKAIRVKLLRRYYQAAREESYALVDYLENCMPDGIYFAEWSRYDASRAPRGDAP